VAGNVTAPVAPREQRMAEKTETIVIGGAQRSGTTLLQTLIANVLRSPLLPEAHVLQQTVAAYRSGLHKWNKTGSFFGGRDTFTGMFREIVAIQHGAMIRHLGYPEFLVLKDPNFSSVADVIREIFPDRSRSVLVVRDPRDIAASFIRIGERQIKEGGSTKYTRRDLGFICDKINASYALESDGGDRWFDATVQYENLVRDPIATVGAALEQARIRLPASANGIPDAPDRLDWLEPEKLHQASWRTELEGGDVSDSSVGSHRTALSLKEIAIVEERCAAIMRRHGYST